MINGNKVVKEPGKKDVKFIFKKAFDMTSIKLTKTKKEPVSYTHLRAHET